MTARQAFARLPGFLLAVAGAGFVVLGLSLEPDPRGFGTHLQLGLPPCAFLSDWNLPCPTCGVTTAFTLVTHGRLLEATITQPFGALLGVIALLLPSLFAASAVAPALDPAALVARMGPLRVLAGIAAAALAAWGIRLL